MAKGEVDLVKNGQMLKDRHSDAANELLQKQFPEVRGLKSPVLGQSLVFHPQNPIHTNATCEREKHWRTVVASDTCKSTVKVFDSVFQCVG